MKALLKLLVTIALIALILWQLGGISPLVAAFSDVRPDYVLLLFGVAIADRALMAFKWRVLLRPHAVQIGFGRVLTIYCVASFWGQVLPMTVGGDVVRLWLTTRHTGRFDTIAASIAMERLLGFVAALLAALVGLVIVGEIVDQATDLGPLWWAGIAIVVAGILAFWLSLSQRLFDMIYGAFPKRFAETKIVRRIRELHQTYLSYRAHGPALRRFFYLTLLEQLMPIVFVWVAARALGVELSMLVAAGVVPLAILITRVPISLAGIGVFEGAFMLLLPLGGVSAADAVSMALLDRAIQIFAMAPWWVGASLSGKGFTLPERARDSGPSP